MNLHTTSGWQQCGEGFLGVNKFKRVVADVRDRTSIENIKRTNTESKINTDTTPEGKIKNKKGQKQDKKLITRESHVKNMHDISSAPWKQGDFLKEFRLDAATPRSDDIIWSTSSSEESLPNECHMEKNMKTSKNSGLRKRKRQSPNICTNVCLRSNSSSVRSDGPVTAEVVNSRLQNLHPEAATDSQDIIEVTSDFIEGKPSAKSMSKIATSAQSCVYQSVGKKQNVSSWMLASFDDMRQASASIEDLKATRSSKLKRKCDPILTQKGNNFKSRAVRKLYLRESLKSSYQISDIESDTEIENFDCSQAVVDSDEEISSDVSCSSSGRKIDLHLEQDVAKHKPEQDGEEAKITFSSGTSSSCSSVQSEKIRASDWIKAAEKHKTPVKEGKLNNFQEDSGKKKRKFARGSLADRLTHVINREKASVRFWYHSLRSGTFDEKSNKSLLLKLVSLEKQYSVFMTRCLLMGESSDSVPCRAVFTCQAVGKLSLKRGMVVQVFAPWQQLEESCGMRTILCTNFVRVLPSVKMELCEQDVTADSSCRISSSALWTCPCLTDSHLPSHACPAAQCPVVPHQTSQVVDCVGPNMVHSVTLHTITVSPPHPCVTSISKRTLLESLERMRGDNSHLPPFTALVLRVFRHRVTGTLKQRLELLVEDSAGTLAIIRLADVFEDNQKAVCQVGWKTCTFSCLHVISRTNRDKEPALFKLVDQVWTQKYLHISSQQSGSDTSQLQLRASTPSFAYILHSASGVSSTFVVEDNDIVKETTMNLMTIQQAVQSEAGTRVSFIARALLPARFSQACGSVSVFVYDSSVDMEDNTVVHRVEVGRQCVMEDIDTAVYLFRDVLVQERGHLKCDNFTVILDMPAWSLWNMQNRIDSSILASVMSCSLKLPHLCCLSEPGSLVSFEGSISEIDEKLAYSWEECEMCGSDKLALVEDSGMKMEVCVTSSNFPSDVVTKIDLTQKTIETILPSGANEEGYDTEQVIGKFIRCSACIVQSKASSSSADASTVPQASWMLTELRC